MTEQELYDTVFGKLCDSKDAHYEAMSKWFQFLSEHKDLTEAEKDRLRTERVPPFYEVEAYADLAKDIEIRQYDDHNRGKVVGTKKLQTGTAVRIVMASRLGDLGITRDLKKQHGYEIRVKPGDGYLTNCRLPTA